jgi:type II secretory pathway predicted ATPase ExeA
MEYLKFYGLTEEPFRNEPDRRFYYESVAQANARMRLTRGIEQHKGLCVLIGQAGCGKTTLGQQLLATLDPERFVTRLLVPAHTSVDSGWLLRRIAVGYGVEQLRPQPFQILAQIYERLVAAHEAGRHPVLLFDEAQMLREREILEQFRALLNLEHKGRRLLSLVLLGMDELDEVLKAEPALAQRVEIRVRLVGLNPEEVADYVDHRLRCANAPEAVFTPEAVQAIHEFSEGTPRLVNTLADNALFEGYMSRAKPVDPSVVQAAAEELELYEPCEESPPEEELATVSPFDPTSGPAAPEAMTQAQEPEMYAAPPERVEEQPNAMETPDETVGLFGPSDLDMQADSSPDHRPGGIEPMPLAEGLQDLLNVEDKAASAAPTIDDEPPAEEAYEPVPEETVTPKSLEGSRLTIEPAAQEPPASDEPDTRSGASEAEIESLFEDIQVGEE